MPKTIETEVFQFDELDAAAKEKALAWCREGWFTYDWWDSIYEDAKEIGSRIGIEIDDIYFSGFSSQGDGACFTGSYSYKKGWRKALTEYLGDPKGYAEHETNGIDMKASRKMWAIAEELQALQKKYFYDVHSTIRHSGHYSHEYCTTIEHETYNIWGGADSIPLKDDKAFDEALRDFMRWIYRQLETEYEYQDADEQMAENIRANEYTFTREGERYG